LFHLFWRVFEGEVDLGQEWVLSCKTGRVTATAWPHPTAVLLVVLKFE
jgi:hypothetical protein